MSEVTPQALFQQAAALHRQGKLTEAEPLYRQIMEAAPENFSTRYMYALLCFQQQRSAEALAAVEAALRLNPRGADALALQGVLLQGAGRSAEALASFDAVLAERPSDAGAWHNRGFVLLSLDRLAEALVALDRSIALNPRHADAWLKRGTTLYGLKRTTEARESFSKSLALKPDQPEALFRRGVAAWIEEMDYDAAASDLAQALRLAPNCPYAPGWLLQVRQNVGDWREFAADVARVDEGVRAGRNATQPFIYQAVCQSPADLQTCSTIYANDRYPALAPLLTAAALAQRRLRPGKIRVGYVSGEFRDQATAYLMAGLYECHDREKFSIIGFDNGWNDQSVVRRRLDAAMDKFVDISQLSGEKAAAMVLAEEIDILVSLNGYFGVDRMDVFCRRPAPIAVNYLGFPATLGAHYIDYLVADRIVIPEAQRKFYTEQIVYLPDTYQVNDSRRGMPENIPSRAACGLPEKSFVFCNFNAGYKLTPAAFAGWMRILRQVPDSVLWLLEVHPRFKENLRREAEAQGVAGTRILFAPMVGQEAHIARLTLADLSLDCLPYNAHTTASDALWAGVPLVTCTGQAFAGRVATSLLGAIGLTELVRESEEEFEALAVALAHDPARLDGLRKKLARNRVTSPLFDTVRFTRNLEAAYAAMWENFRRGEPPRSFGV